MTGSNSKPNIWRRFGTWLSSLIRDASTKALANIISSLLIALVTLGTIGVLFFKLTDFLPAPITAPTYVILILSLVALLGILRPATGLFNVIAESHRSRTPKKRLEKLSFEGFPREWRAYVWREDSEWQVDLIGVFCSEHNLKLQASYPNHQGKRI